jgi:hypothetical protein
MKRGHSTKEIWLSAKGEMPSFTISPHGCAPSPRTNTHESITHLSGATWKWTRQQVIDSMEAGTNTFITRVNGKRADVGVVNGPNGKYVRTHADGFYNDNLLALPEYP